MAKRSRVAIAIVDRGGRVLFDTLKIADEQLGTLCDGTRLAPAFEALVLRLIAEGRFDRDTGATPIALFGEHSFVRVHPVRDARAPFSLIAETFLVSIETLRNRDELGDATRRFQLTHREAEVLSYLMRGEKAGEIAVALNLAEGTVQNYYKRLLAKTNSRNRAAMVAAVLGWKQGAGSAR